MHKKFALILTLLAFTAASFPGLVAEAADALPVRIKYQTTSVGASSYVQLVAATQKGLKAVSFLHSGVFPISIGYGASGSEVAQVTIPGLTVGGNSVVAPAPVVLPLSAGYGTRISIIALGGTNTVGELQLNLFYN